jgi:hypothetical protein
MEVKDKIGQSKKKKKMKPVKEEREDLNNRGAGQSGKRK